MSSGGPVRSRWFHLPPFLHQDSAFGERFEAMVFPARVRPVLGRLD